MVNPIKWMIENMKMYITSPYGPRGSGFHRGTDLGGIPCGAPVRTPFSGKVVAAQTSGMGTWGNTVCIELDPNGKYISLNAHLQTITVKVGQRVKQGDQIGTNGGTNHSGANYPCHIHYEVLLNNADRPWRGTIWGDPEKFFLTQIEPIVSKKFSAGQIIYTNTTANVNVRSKPGTSHSVVRQSVPGELNEIMPAADNGIQVGAYHWWKIQDGWVAEDFFEVYVAKEPDEPSLPDRQRELLEALLITLEQLDELINEILGGIK